MSTALAVTRPTESERLRTAIYGVLGQIVPKEAELEHSYVRLGSLLAAFKAGEHWRGLIAATGQPYPNFDAFMLELRDQYNRGRTQLWAYLSVAEKLLPVIPADTLDEMGISKAQEIKRALSVVGRKITPEILAAAVDPKVTIKELRAVLAVAFNITDDTRPTGTWFDFDGCFFEPDERKEFVDAVKVTTALLGLKKEIPAHVQRKEVFLAWAREFFGTHATEVYGPQPPEAAPDA